MEPVARNKFKKFDADSFLGCLEQDCDADNMPIKPMSVGQVQYDVIEACVDSGASETVGPKGVFKGFPLKPSIGSSAGNRYVSATTHRTPNLGERKVLLSKPMHVNTSNNGSRSRYWLASHFG